MDLYAVIIYRGLTLSLLIAFLSNGAFSDELRDKFISQQLEQQAKFYQENAGDDMPLPAKLLVFEADIGWDEKPEIFISNNNLPNGKYGYLWGVYRFNRADSYENVGEIEFHPQTVQRVRFKDELRGLIIYYSGGGGTGSVYRLFVENDKVITERLGTANMLLETSEPDWRNFFNEALDETYYEELLLPYKLPNSTIAFICTMLVINLHLSRLGYFEVLLLLVLSSPHLVSQS